MKNPTEYLEIVDELSLTMMNMLSDALDDEDKENRFLVINRVIGVLTILNRRELYDETSDTNQIK